jgi:transposase InsO family protein
MQELDLRAARKLFRAIWRLVRILISLAATTFQYMMISGRPSRSLAAENLFLRKQLAMFQEREIKPRRADDATRAALVWLSRAFNWREALVVVKPATLVRWHREGFRLYWKIKSRPGRPALPGDLRALIRRMALENVAWGEERIADELLLKLGLRVSPRTVRKYMPAWTDDTPGACRSDQRWMTFVRNHAEAIVSCDFFTVVTATFNVLYVFIVVEHATRRILHFRVTGHPTANWTLQQFREAIPSDHSYGYLIRDRDAKFSRRLDKSLHHMRLKVIKTPVRSPKANAICERTIGTIRRECMDYLIPLGERHLYKSLAEWIGHFNAARPHSALAPGIPDPPITLPAKLQLQRHKLPSGSRLTTRPVLGGLHHEYALQLAA